MFFQGIFDVNQDIVEVCGYKYIQVLSENGIDKRLKGCQCIRESKWHYCILVMPVFHTKGCLPFFTFSHPN